MTKYDVAIIGGGLAGCSAAFHLARRGARVILFERGRCGSQASGVNFGGVRQQGRNVAELPLSIRSRTLWARMTELVGIDCEFVQSGHLKLAHNEQEMSELEAYRQAAEEWGLKLDLIGTSRLRSEYAYLGESVIGGSLSPTDGQANPRLAAPAFARAARRLGAEVREQSPVEKASYDGDSFVLEVSGQTYVADVLLNVAGAWAGNVAAWFGEAVQETVMAPNMCVTEPLPQFIGPNLGVCGGGVYIRQSAHGSVVFGAGVGVADAEALRARPLAAVTAEAAQLAIELVPRLRDALLVRTWSGIEGKLPDSIPVVGPSEIIPHLYHAFGFSGHGFQLGPAVGVVLSELALDGETPTPIDGLSISRFANKASVSRLDTPSRSLFHGK